MRPSAAPMGKPYRVSSDGAWPLRDANGLTFADKARIRAITAKLKQREHRE